MTPSEIILARYRIALCIERAGREAVNGLDPEIVEKIGLKIDADQNYIRGGIVEMLSDIYVMSTSNTGDHDDQKTDSK